uniref:Uncharacterized protein n=1 Tax=Opuntia streptacantha TaxID=393608 RepID=A0A7C8YVH6_OPUST
MDIVAESYLMGTMLGLLTWTVRVSSASNAGKLNLKEVRSMEMSSKAGSRGRATIKATAAAAVAPPTVAEVQFHFFTCLLLIGYGGSSLLSLSPPSFCNAGWI